MTSSLSEEEFHRMQLQLLELRTANYELESSCKKQERELLSVAEKLENTEKDVERATKIINKSKRNKEVELLIQENENLQRKLQSQEDEFRLQNETLLQELATLVSTNENLDKRLSEASATQEKSNKQEESNPQTADELRKLQAQNSALQKNFTASQEKYEKVINSLQEEVNRFRSLNKIDNQNTVTINDSTNSIISNTMDSADTRAIEVLCSSHNDRTMTSEEYIKEINDLNMSLDMEAEEKRLVKGQLAQAEQKHKDRLLSLQTEFDKLTEKYKKKQESFIQLQEEKEKLFSDSSKMADELQASKERDQKYYTDQINKLQREIEKQKQNHMEVEKIEEEKVLKLEKHLAQLQQQVDASSIVTTQQLQDQATKYNSKISSLENQLLAVKQHKDDLAIQLEESQKAGRETIDQLYAIQQDRDVQIQALQETNRVAEKRKNLLDELAIKYQKDLENDQAKMKEMEDMYLAESMSLKKDFQKEKERTSELEKTKQLLEEAKTQIASLEEAEGWLKKRLTATEESFDALKRKLEEKIKILNKSHQEELELEKITHENEVGKLKIGHEEAVQQLLNNEERLNQELDGQKNEVNKLQQQIKDGVDEKKIHEKKGMAIVKDLKRQLHAERKKAEKLQERLQDVLSDTKSRQSVEELFRPTDQTDTTRTDCSSVSSWNTGASGFSYKDSNGLHSPSSQKSEGLSTNEVDDEFNDLLSRVSFLQEEKWKLEDKVNHLETSNAAMAEDILQKTKIIEHYVMQNRTDIKHTLPHEEKSSPMRKVLDLVNKDGNEAKHMNKKLQNMLEETLTKNMHLQKDMEILSQELVRLGQMAVDGKGQTKSDSKNKIEKDDSYG